VSNTDPIIDEATARSIRRWLNTNFELVSIVVMSLTAILTAWSGFQGATWTAIQTERYADATNDHTESVRASNAAEEATSIDLSVFIAWLDETTDGDDAAAEFIYERFPDRLRVATDAWLALDPFEDPDAPPSPFVMEEYVVPPSVRAEELSVSAEEHTIAAQEATERANEYVLMTVLFATVLFFASVASKLTGVGNRWALLSLAIIGLIGGSMVLLATPSV
jgi:hypothetical protein